MQEQELGMDENTKEPVIKWALVFSSIWMKDSVPELSRPFQALKLGNFKSIEQNVLSQSCSE